MLPCLELLQVIHAVAIEKRALQPPEGTPPQLARLMRACMAHDSAERPSFAALVANLDSMATEPARSGSPPAY